MSMLLRLLPLLVVGCLLLQSLQPANAVDEEREEYSSQIVEGYMLKWTKIRKPGLAKQVNIQLS